MDAYQFGKPTGKNGGIRFGVDRDQTIKALRELADRLEATRDGDVKEGDVLLQAVEAESKATLDDFTQTKLILTFVEIQ